MGGTNKWTESLNMPAEIVVSHRLFEAIQTNVVLANAAPPQWILKAWFVQIIAAITPKLLLVVGWQCC